MRPNRLFRLGVSMTFVTAAASIALAQSPAGTEPETRQTTIVAAAAERAWRKCG